MAWEETDRITELERKLEKMGAQDDSAWTKGGGKGGGKGKGVAAKGKGKSKGKGKGMSLAPKPGDWLCHEAGCEANGQYNFASRSSCCWCGCSWRPRPGIQKHAELDQLRKEVQELKKTKGGAAARARSRSASRSRANQGHRSRSKTRRRSRSVQFEDDEGWGVAKGRKGRKKKRKAANENEKKEAADDKEDEVVEIMEVDEQPFTDELETVEKRKLGIPHKAAKREFHSLFPWPSEDKAPARNAADAVNESGACRKGALLAEKDAAIEMYIRFVTEAEGKQTMQAELQRTLDGMKKERETIAKKGQELVVNVERMKETQQKELADWVEKRAKWKSASEIVAGKTDKRKAALREQIQIATRALAELESVENANKVKWQEELETQTKWHGEKMAEWQTRIDAAAVVQTAEKSNSVEENDEQADYNLETEWIPSDAPTVTVKSEFQSAWLSQLWAQLQHWNKNSKTAVLYHEIAGPGAEGVAAIRDLLGDTFWEKMYGSRVVTEHDIVPLQLKFLLTFTLGAVTKDIVKYAEHADDVKKAEEAFMTYKSKSVNLRKAEKMKSVLKPAKKKEEKAKDEKAASAAAGVVKALAGK